MEETIISSEVIKKEPQKQRRHFQFSHCLKVYEKIINLKVRRQVENELRDEEYHFRNNKSTVDLIFAGRQIPGKSWEFSKTHVWSLLVLKRYESIN
jgi:hypothetical protein